MLTRGFTSVSSTLYIVVLRPIASASDRIATTANPRWRASVRAVDFTSYDAMRMTSLEGRGVVPVLPSVFRSLHRPALQDLQRFLNRETLRGIRGFRQQ